MQCVWVHKNVFSATKQHLDLSVAGGPNAVTQRGCMLGNQEQRAAGSPSDPTIRTLDTACLSYIEHRQRMPNGLRTVCTVYQAGTYQAMKLQKLLPVDPSVLRPM